MEAQLEAIHPVLMVRDVAVSIRFYEQLGFRVTFRDAPSDPKYAGLRRDQVVIHVQWHDSREWQYPVDRPNYRIVVRDVDALFAEFQTAMPSLDSRGVQDTPWGTREFHLRDPDRNGLQFYRAL